MLPNRHRRIRYNSLFFQNYFKQSEPTPDETGIGQRLDTHKLLVRIRDPRVSFDDRQNMAFHIAQRFGRNGKALRHAPYVILSVDPRESERICSILNLRNPSKLGVHESVLPHEMIEYSRVGHLKRAIPIVKRDYHAAATRWNLTNIGADIANKITIGAGVTVGVIDTGIDYTHKELKDNFLDCKGYDFVRDTDDPMDGEEHGTHVAGIYAGKTVGVAPGCTLYALRVLNEYGYGSEVDVLAAIDWCIEHKVGVINMSLGSSYYSKDEELVCLEAFRNGIVIVAAAGNDGKYAPSYPAALDGVVAVAAVNQYNEHENYSNRYPTNDISAPGGEIYSSIPGDRYATFSGTSMATPHVGACLALARSESKSEPEDLEAVMKTTAQELGDWDYYGAGLVRADKLISSLTNLGCYDVELRRCAG